MRINWAAKCLHLIGSLLQHNNIQRWICFLIKLHMKHETYILNKATNITLETIWFNKNISGINLFILLKLNTITYHYLGRQFD